MSDESFSDMAQPDNQLVETIVDHATIKILQARQLGQSEAIVWRLDRRDYNTLCESNPFSLERIANPSLIYAIGNLKTEEYKLGLRQIVHYSCSSCSCESIYDHPCFRQEWGRDIYYALAVTDLDTCAFTDKQLIDSTISQAALSYALAKRRKQEEAAVWRFDSNAYQDAGLTGAFRLDRITDEKTQAVITRLKGMGLKVRLRLEEIRSCHFCDQTLGHRYCGEGSFSHATQRSFVLCVG